jgi:MYXO-CTERM domain-containing protein
MNHSDVATATMYLAATAGEKTKCSLAADDIAGICTMYNSTCDPVTLGKTADAGGDTAATVPPSDGGGTCSAGRTASGSAWLLLMAAGWILRRRRT